MAHGAKSTGDLLKLNFGDVSSVCHRAVVGVDFGTACSGVAYAYKAEPEMMKLGAPSAQNDAESKVPTAILINDDDTYCFGHAALAKYNEYLMNTDSGDKLPGQLFKGFKMLLKDRQTGMDTIMASSVTGQEHSLMDLVVKCLTSLKEYAIKRMSYGYGGEVDPLNHVQWVLTVPAIWNDFGKAFMRKAALLAGMISTEQSDHLMLVLEPEGAALAVHVGASKHNLLGVGSRFLVLDCGGGTIDITTYDVEKVCPLQMKVIGDPCGGHWGGDTVNEAFRNFLKELWGDEFHERAIASYDFHTINQAFEEAKIFFNPTNNPKTVKLAEVLDNKQQLLAWADAYNQKHPDKPVLVTPQLRNGFLTMSKELMLSFFEPSLFETVEATRQVMTANSAIRCIIVVGGYGSSPVLTDRVRLEFHQKLGVQVLLSDPYPKPQAAIAMGAVYFGLYRSVIQARTARYSYGASMYRDNVGDCFDMFVSKGEDLPLIHKVVVSGLPITPEQEVITWRVYRSKDDNPFPKLVTDAVFVGDVTVPCPKHVDQVKRRQFAEFNLGGPEIVVNVVNAVGTSKREVFAMY